VPAKITNSTRKIGFCTFMGHRVLRYPTTLAPALNIYVVNSGQIHLTQPENGFAYMGHRVYAIQLALRQR